MNSSNKIGAIFKKMRYETPNPVRDWFTLIILFSLALASIIVWNIWTFDTVAHGGSIGFTETNSTSIFNRSIIDEIKIIFANRTTEKVKYEIGVYRYADPSQ